MTPLGPERILSTWQRQKCIGSGIEPKEPHVAFDPTTRSWVCAYCKQAINVTGNGDRIKVHYRRKRGESGRRMNSEEGTTSTDYARGYALGRFLKEDRKQGGNYDCRWDFADEARQGTLDTFKEFRRGFDAAFDEVDCRRGEP